MRILIIGGIARSLLIFRGPLLSAMVAAGHSVIASANGNDYIVEDELKKMNVSYFPIFLDRAGMNPINEIKSLINIIRIISQIKPDIVLSYTIKPVIYGCMASRFCKVPFVYSLITGLGYSFGESRSLIQRFLGTVAHKLYQFSLKKSKKVFFQNPDDQTYFLQQGLVRSNQVVLINGSGVDIDHFAVSKLPDEPVFLMIARLLQDKGVREYVKTAVKVKELFPQARFLLVGNLDLNPNSIRKSELRQWEKAGAIEYLGYLNNVKPVIQKCRFYVLPSYYREGIPRTVLEAMAMGRPIITTDAPGCRETILLTSEGKRQRERGEEMMIGENGFLVQARNSDALVKAILYILGKPDLAEQMAKRSREIAEEKFDVDKVNAVILNAMGLT